MMLAASLPTAYRPSAARPSGYSTWPCASVGSPANVPMSPTNSWIA
ncbi:Uncharacterised protein [Bordetella pertussis]|nr:Uncharacterised protein [Bordetella pertussis]